MDTHWKPNNNIFCVEKLENIVWSRAMAGKYIFYIGVLT